MNRRLYFLFPDAAHARRAIDKLPHETGVDIDHIHTLARSDESTEQLPRSTPAQRRDFAGLLETALWNGNLALFALALVVLVAALLQGSAAWAALALLVMGLTFVGGAWFTNHVPHVHLDEFRDALGHGEVLLMVDVPRTRVPTVENYLLRRYPEAVAGGSSWSVDAFGL